MDPCLDAPLDMDSGGGRIDEAKGDEGERSQRPEGYEDDEQISNDEAERRAEACARFDAGWWVGIYRHTSGYLG